MSIALGIALVCAGVGIGAAWGYRTALYVALGKMDAPSASVRALPGRERA